MIGRFSRGEAAVDVETVLVVVIEVAVVEALPTDSPSMVFPTIGNIPLSGLGSCFIWGKLSSSSSYSSGPPPPLSW